MRRCSIIFIWLWCLTALAGEVIPPSPSRYFNDEANVVSAGVADQLNTQLENFEKSSGNQFVVAVYPKMQSDSDIADYTVRVARAWKVGQKGTNNGVVLFVFTQDRKMFIQVGYGLEGALPDALCHQITEYEIKPHFKVGDYAGGLTAGINAVMAATRHEYKGTGTTVDFEKNHRLTLDPESLVTIIMIAFILLPIIFGRPNRRRGWIFTSGGWGGCSGGGGFFGGGGDGGGGGFSGGGGGGGGFSGGGGSFGGGGAGSSW